jgi:chemotaxis protein methyltransferase CheR
MERRMRPVRNRAGTREAAAGCEAGDLLLTREDFSRIAAMLHADAGIHLAESKAALVYSRLAKRLRSLGLESFRDYCTLVDSREGRGERQQMLAALTTNVTKFFREPHHFDHLAKTVLPPLVEAARRGGRVRLWSAACSNGQEPYSIALTLLSLMPDAARYDVKVLATDIDPNMLKEAERGVYSETVLAAVPAALRARWFFRIPGKGDRAREAVELKVADSLRALVSFRELNLVGTWPMKGMFHAIFCRNVAIYFTEATQRELWSRFVPRLEPGGTLYIGHSERLTGCAAAAFETDGITTYRLLNAAAAREARP